jgi:integrase/recombinase XerD
MQGRLLKDYRTYLKIERAMSLNTVASYCSDVGKFLDGLDGVSPEKVVADDIVTFLKGMDGMSERTQARFVSALRSFYRWMVLEGSVSDNPCDLVDSPKLGRYLPDVLSEEEVEAILSVADTSSSQGIRDKAILEILYGCGLRVSETVGMKISCMYFDEGFIRVRGKGSKERLVPVGGYAVDAVRTYLEVRPLAADKESDDILFLNRYGRKLSRQSVFKMIKTSALLAGIRKNISPHTLRHSFATHMIERGADLRVVQDMLGHESVTTTEIYTHIDSTTWQKDILDHHPRK